MLDHLIEPDALSEKEQWVEDQLERRLDEMGVTFNACGLPDWFDDYVNWEAVENHIRLELMNEYDENETERLIASKEM